MVKKFQFFIREAKLRMIILSLYHIKQTKKIKNQNKKVQIKITITIGKDKDKLNKKKLAQLSQWSN